MKKYIVGYLTENYYLDKSEIGNAGIYAFDDERQWKVPVNAKKLIEEVVTLFGYSFTRTKWLIHNWAKSQKPDYCLKFYWTSHEIVINFAMPIVRSVMASTIGQDLVIVQPPKGPSIWELDHPTPNYILATDPVNENPNITIAKPRISDRQATLRKWIDSGLLDNFDL